MLTHLCRFLTHSPRRSPNRRRPVTRRSRGQIIVIFGLALMVIIFLAPNGIWPSLKRRLGLEEKR